MAWGFAMRQRSSEKAWASFSNRERASAAVEWHAFNAGYHRGVIDGQKDRDSVLEDVARGMAIGLLRDLEAEEAEKLTAGTVVPDKPGDVADSRSRRRLRLLPWVWGILAGLANMALWVGVAALAFTFGWDWLAQPVAALAGAGSVIVGIFVFIRVHEHLVHKNGFEAFE